MLNALINDQLTNHEHGKLAYKNRGVELKGCRCLPLQHTATGGGGCGNFSLRRAVALVEVGAADIVDGCSGEVLRRLLGPAKLLLGLPVDLDGVQHGDAGGIHGSSDFLQVKRKGRCEDEKVTRLSNLTRRKNLRLWPRGLEEFR